jgi:predicted Zn-dependent protease
MLSRVPEDWVRLIVIFCVSVLVVVQTASNAAAQITRSFSTVRLQAYQLTNLSFADEQALGASIDQYLKQEGLTLYTNDEVILDYVNEVAQRMIEVSRWPNRRYTVQIIDDEGTNAFATVGGYIYLQTGMLEMVQNEAELAGVLAHEIAHIEEQDGLNQLWHMLTTQQLSMQEDRLRRRAVVLGGQLRSLSNSHEDEYIADRIAFRMLGRAGYAQQTMVDLLNRLAAADQQPARLGWVSTHPDVQSRLYQLYQLLVNEASVEGTSGLDQIVYSAIMESL